MKVYLVWCESPCYDELPYVIEVVNSEETASRLVEELTKNEQDTYRAHYPNSFRYEEREVLE
jgi:PII-like signaling protein